MFDCLLTSLVATLRPHFALSKTRLETLAVLIVGLANTRTVNLSHIASQFPGDALHASNYRRLQRFFQFVHLDGDIASQLIIRLLNLSRPKLLALDRTNWKLGSRDVNVLVLALVTRRFRVPIMWTLLDHQGNSSTAQRIALMERYLRLFGAGSITALLADREFIGAKWMNFLSKNNIPFVIRIKGDMAIRLENGKVHLFQSLLRKRKKGTWSGWLNGMEKMSALRFEAKRIKDGELLIVATNLETGSALNLYRKRWGIECLFGDAKTRGFNLEDTHITDPGKLSTLLVVVALAIAWACTCARDHMGLKAIGRKSHGRREKSWFRIGLDALRNWILFKPNLAIGAWTKSCPRIPLRKVKCI